jgi:hypothetical protein
MRKWIFVSLFLAMTPAAAWAMEDTPENRAAQVDRYLKAIPPETVLADVAEKVAKTLPPEQRQAYVTMLTKHMNMERFTQAMRAALIKWFTADEDQAMAEFYASPNGKSIMKKMGDYMAELMPTMQEELMKAAQAAQSEMQSPPK